MGSVVSTIAEAHFVRGSTVVIDLGMVMMIMMMMMEVKEPENLSVNEIKNAFL